MLGSNFFQDYIGNKRDKNQKTYDHQAFLLDEEEDLETMDTLWASEEPDDDTVAFLASEQDEDAVLVVQFEEAVTEAIQNDGELGAYYSSYMDARRRLSEKFRSRGFWPVGASRKSGKSHGKKGKGSSKGKLTLSQKIARSRCRACGQMGHWKNECRNKGINATSSDTRSEGSAPTSVMVVDDIPESLLSIPEIAESVTSTLSSGCFRAPMVSGATPNQGHQSGVTRDRVWGFQQRLRTSLRKIPQLRREKASPTPCEGAIPKEVSHKGSCHHKSLTANLEAEKNLAPNHLCETHFASSGTVGVVDIGASQTVIGSSQVGDLLKGLPREIQQQVRRTSCSLVFRFGNQQTLHSKHALLLPLQDEWFRIAVVNGQTPFLLSNSFLKQVQAVIDTAAGTLWSKRLGKYLHMETSSKNLFLMNINQLWSNDSFSSGDPSAVTLHSSTVSETAETSKAQGVGEFNESHVQRSMASAGEQKHQSHPISSHHESKPATSSSSATIENHPEKASHGDPLRTVSSAAEAEPPGEEQDRPRSVEFHDHRRAGNREDRFPGSQEGFSLQGCLRGQHLGVLHAQQVREQQEARTPDLHPLCSTSHETDGQAAGKANQQLPASDRESNQQVRSSSPRRELGLGGTGLPGIRTSGGSWPASSREPSTEPTHGPSGVCHAGVTDTSSRTEDQTGGLILSAAQAQKIRDQLHVESSIQQHAEALDYDFLSKDREHTYQQRCQNYIRKFQKELEGVIHQHQKKSMRSPQIDLLEVMCSGNSELTKQAHTLGGNAKRVSKQDGDLSTIHGRRSVFTQLVVHRPQNVWYSPECGPWCKWSVFNMGKSLECLQSILTKRSASLWQVSLAIVLHRHQVSVRKQFHLEQPRGSHMLDLPIMQEVIAGTQECMFDMCEVGDLRDPVTCEPIRKPLHVRTTSRALVRAIHGRYCHADHQHKHIAGSTKVDGRSIPLSRYTELYPKKFAKQVMKVILHNKDHHDLVYVGTTDEEHPTKRRRLGSKLSPAEIARRYSVISWQTVMHSADKLAPRIGPVVVDSGTFHEQVQAMCPQHRIHHVVICRGTDRYEGPNQPMQSREAPLRRRICIRRRLETPEVDDQWEPWENLS